jgi:hypothetical protein
MTPVTLLSLTLVPCAIAADALLFGEWRWKSATRKLRAALEAARRPPLARFFDSRELENLPSPVRRYFLAVLPPRQRMITAVSLVQTGTFNLSETSAQWKPFTATQRVVTPRPGFDWDARIAMFAGLWVRVHDAYVAGEGRLHAAVYGLISKANLRDTGELARGELMRFFMEAPWCPTALLPSQGVVWTAVDEHSANATLRDGGHAITLLFHFDAAGLIDAARAGARGRIANGKAESLPWQGRFWNYAVRDGLRVPLEAEVEWLTPAGAKPYCRVLLTTVTYEFAR